MVDRLTFRGRSLASLRSPSSSASGSGTPTITPSRTSTGTPTSSGTASHTSSPSPTPYCAASDFRSLPRTDLVGSLVGATHSPAGPVLTPSEPACRQACCLAPVCDGYSFDAGGLFFHAESLCYLLVNVTQLVPTNTMASGLRESVLL